jgi:bacillopeptidase F (M6 metalloprotease family)
VAHFDSLKLDTASMSSIPANTSNTFMTKDMSNETLTSAKSISAGGWFVTPGGVKSYKIRVIKVDGVAVTDPKLVGGVKSENCGATDGVTKVGTGKGWAITCGLNARYTAASIDLSAYAGKTVEFEIVAITNFGEEAIVARFTNVKVPAAE